MGQTELSFAALLLTVAYVQAANFAQCCTAKTVGGESYKLVDAEEDTESFGCKDSCVYEKIGSQGSRFCFKEGDFEAMCNDIDMNAQVESTSCVIAGQMYSSWMYRKVAANAIKGCAEFCCESNVCNYWSFGSSKGQTHCYLYSQVFGNPTNVKGFSSGLKGCGTGSGPMLVPTSCLLTNTEITTPITTIVADVNNYVACQEKCTEALGDFWSFGHVKTQGEGPGTCRIYSTAPGDGMKANPFFISGPADCPPADAGTCPKSSSTPPSEP